jgi:hypothetical protein
MPYKIQRKSDGLFVTSTGNWSKNGKIWRTLGHLRNHINSTYLYQGKDFRNIEIVEVQLIEREISRKSLYDEKVLINERNKQEDERTIKEWKKEQNERGRILYEQLKHRFEDDIPITKNIL